MFKLSPPLIICIILSLCFFNNLRLAAQEIPEFKFGKLGKEDILNSKFEADSGAHAFYLFDSGTSYIIYDNTEGFRILNTRHCAIKILSKSGYDYASFEIPLYHENNSPMEEKVIKIKAVTYNIIGDKITETDLSKKDIFNEKENENWSKTKFTMPDVKEGSVIEVEYVISSDFLWNLPTWQFQRDIPCKWSILETRIPEYFNYSKEMKGYIRLYHSETNSLHGNINLVSIDRNVSKQGVTRQMNNENITFDVAQTILVAKDVPAFDPEPYIDAPINYISTISFELQSTNFPNQPMKFFTTTWEQVGQSLNDSESFGRQLSAVGSSKDKVEELKIGELTEIEKAEAIYNFVKSNTKWDRRVTKYCDNVKQVLKNGVGTSGDINILLINMLDAAGLDVNPVLLRTRSDGKIPFTHPSLSSLNYVIAAVKTGDKILLLDATEDEVPFNFLPVRCLNDRGILLKRDDKIEWINLTGLGMSRYITFATLKILENGDIDADIVQRREGHFAIDRRIELDVDKEQIIKNFQEENEGFSVTLFDTKNIDNPSLQLEEHVAGTIADKVVLAGDMMYFNPCLYEKYGENPFKIEKREYPVDFAHPWENRIVQTFVIPEGWKVESLPTSISIKLPDNDGKYIYSIQTVGDKIIFSQSFSISNPLILPDKYLILKEFFKQVVDKQQEQIVLKKA